ncbi:hypothetical protein ILUMI_18644 [Ignelater luminosus]|uniref:MD-2-related lipid-recognition domain-containing protein n=1 Tax=Ignelater luminosus TaxID=2038154 RepID=A0A8K0CHM0_IGNLU|nr:hypothetical protein ILUMI_18644 [Ignelater luminosus]
MDVILKKTFPNNTQLIEFGMSVPYPIHNNTLATCTLEYNVIGNTWAELTKTDDKNGMCHLFNTNGGDLWFDIQKQASMTPGACPIPKGNYHGDGILINLSKSKIPPIPPGNYRTTIEVRNKSNNSVILCKMFDIEGKA